MSQPSQDVRILFLAAEPTGMARISLNREFRNVRESHQSSTYRHRFEVYERSAARPADLRREILGNRPQIVHFCGHGSGSRGLAFEDEQGTAQLIPTLVLADLFRLAAPLLRCVVLNACYSEEQAQEIHRHIDYVIGMKSEITDAAAISFSRGFYDALFEGEPVERAFEYGKNAIQLEGAPDADSLASVHHLLPANASAGVAIPEHLKPVLLVREGAAPGVVMRPERHRYQLSRTSLAASLLLAIGAVSLVVPIVGNRLWSSASTPIIEFPTDWKRWLPLVPKHNEDECAASRKRDSKDGSRRPARQLRDRLGQERLWQTARSRQVRTRLLAESI